MSFRLSVYSLRGIKMKCEMTKYMQAYKATPVVVLTSKKNLVRTDVKKDVIDKTSLCSMSEMNH